MLALATLSANVNTEAPAVALSCAHPAAATFAMIVVVVTANSSVEPS